MIVSREKIFIKTSGQLFIHPDINKEWMVKIPTSKHGLNGAGTCSLKLVEYKYNLAEKFGILYIDMSQRKYVFIPNHILKDHPPEPKTFLGVKNSLFVYHIGAIIKEHCFTLHGIPEGDTPVALKTGIAGDVRKKFGL